MGTVKMSGEVSRSRQKKAAASTAKKGQNGQSGQNGSQAPAGSSKSSAFMKEQKKKSKDRNNQNKNKMPSKAKASANGGFLSSTTILIVLVALTGVSVASYHQYPEKVQAVYEFCLPRFKTVWFKSGTLHHRLMSWYQPSLWLFMARVQPCLPRVKNTSKRVIPCSHLNFASFLTRL